MMILRKRAWRSRKCGSRPHPRGEYREAGIRSGNQRNAEGGKRARKNAPASTPRGNIEGRWPGMITESCERDQRGRIRKREHAPHPKGEILGTSESGWLPRHRVAQQKCTSVALPNRSISPARNAERQVTWFPVVPALRGLPMALGGRCRNRSLRSVLAPKA